MMIAARNAFMTRLLPYDAELEYLESTGTQWIDTGVMGDENTRVEICCSISSLYSGAYSSIFGCYGTNTDSISIFGGGRTRFGSQNTSFSRPSINTLYQISIDKDGFTVNGTTTAWAQTDHFETDGNLIAFGRNITTYGYFNGRYYSLKIYQSGVLVRDFIPVRRGTVGYLYDRVSKRLFGNSGTGDFVLGPDVVPVEYIESHGTEYIDTGAPLNLQHSIRCVFQETNTSTYYPGVVSGRGTSPTPVHLRTYTILSPRFDYWNGDEANPGISNKNLTRGELLELHAVADIENATLNVFVNGVKSEATILLQAGTTPNSVLLFRDTRNVDNFIGRLHLFQELDGSVTVRSFRPVRVGSGSTWEGAMMDVLTRRIYRNAGTGAFTWGNDLKYPIPRE